MVNYVVKAEYSVYNIVVHTVLCSVYNNIVVFKLYQMIMKMENLSQKGKNKDNKKHKRKVSESHNKLKRYSY